MHSPLGQRLQPFAPQLTAALLVIVSRWLARPPIADDMDSINFLLAMSKSYDLAALTPHFPGYPIYIAFGKLLVALGLDALSAASSISSLASGVSALGLFVCARRLFADRPGTGVILLHAVAWLPWMLGSGAESESLGVSLAIGSFAALALDEPRPSSAGLIAGITLGVRASYWPLVLSGLVLAIRMKRAQRFILGASIGLALWAVPFFSIVGVRDFIRLGLEHTSGHFRGWGGTIVTVPNIFERVFAIVRALFFDGFAPSLFAIAAIGIIAVLALRRSTRLQDLKRPTIIVLLVLAPYAAWVFVAQNVVEQPRHTLPLVEGMILAFASWLGKRPIAIVSVAIAALCVNVPLAVERRAVLPAAAQAVNWIEAKYPNTRPSQVAVMAGRSTRFFQALPDRFPVRQRVSLSEAILDLSHFDRLPSVTLLTSEIDLGRGPVPDHWHIEDGPMFCRDPRIDRAAPCLSLKMLTWSAR